MYKCGLYLRTSKNSVDINNSIEMQEKLIMKYIESKQDITVEEVYVDNGYSGLDFVRPGFIRLMEHIDKDLINCVIVKDLSRLGRDYIQTGMYIQYIFPSKGVRIISINDRYDSLYVSEVDKYFMIPLRNYINESYSRDISNKVRSSLYMKMKKGDCVISKVPYGYKKVKIMGEYKSEIVIDKEVKDIIQRIFTLSLKGYSLQSIANYLNEQNILTPYEHRMKNDEKYYTPFIKYNIESHNNDKKKKWYPMMVKRILYDQMYIGTLVQGKVNRLSYKIREREYKKPYQWFYSYNNHKAIIDKKTFYVVNRLLQYDIRKKSGNIVCERLSGIILCGKCGKSMYDKDNRYECGKCGGLKIEKTLMNNIIDKFIEIVEGIKENIERQDIVLNIMNIIIYEANFVEVIIYNE